MEDLESTISQILGNPESMAQIMSLAKSLGVTPPPGEEAPQESSPQEEPAQESPVSDGSLQMMMELMQQFGSTDQREAKLLNALKPYFSQDRQQRIDRALRIAKLSKIAGATLRSFGKKE